ncbi:hemolysin [Staphylococcus sp. HMSC036D05]|uniref:hemolysin family protein n=1 Tax=Staphylococcus sp. HMSC036D05 TaxID=1715059 RepID=UPI0008A9C2B3|nr:CNNM domain-containing protein [Staphylococcus sp. HMSC036D05]OHO71458.1 hemolysin [Staphylococcus sp. HMSC036D05]
MIVAIVILIFVSFFFSGSETALTAANRTKFQTEAKNGDRKAKGLTRLLDKPSEFITTILIGNNVANIILPILVTILAIRMGINIGIAATIITIVIILISEVIPKSVAATFPDKISRLVYPVINICVIVLKPITVLLNKMTDGINHMLSRGKPVEKRFNKEEIRTLLNIAGREGAFNEVENARLQNVMDFEKLKVTDVDTTPRVNVVAFSKEVTYDEAYETVMNEPYTRYPVYDEDIDDIIGVFHSKYLLAWSKHKNDRITNYASSPLFVNEHNRAEWVLRKMTVTRKHLAIVLDEYGGTDGIVSHEDLIEELLGMDIEDEMDQEEEEKLKNQKFPQSVERR